MGAACDDRVVDNLPGQGRVGEIDEGMKLMG